MSGEEPNLEEIHRLLKLQVLVLAIGSFVDRNNVWIWSVATLAFVATPGLWVIIPYWSIVLLSFLTPNWCRRLSDRIERRIERLQQGYEVKA